MNRRTFITTGATASAALLLNGCNENNRQAIDYSKHPSQLTETADTTSGKKQKKVTLRLATSWPASFPIMGTGVEHFAERVKAASGGSLIIKIYPKETLVPALAVFDAASTGEIDIFHSGPYYWKGKNSAFALFSGTPFGLTSEEINSWMLFGGGMEFWREMYAKHNLYPLLGGNTNVQMGGWFRKPIRSLADLKGLKMRVPGIGGEVFSRLGVNPVLLAAGEIYPALERGMIDATEWVGPALDLKMGFYKVAKYYYSGWHEPGSVLELTFNKKVWESLSSEHQAIVQIASEEMNSRMSLEFHSKNLDALQEIQKLGITIQKFPDDVNRAAKKALEEYLKIESVSNPDFKKIYESMENYLQKSRAWSNIGLGAFLNTREV
ncbi:TRAP transporter substrate-binding protein DctP [Sulfuricurvum sp.]|uniref:TRAP transporter substrate-binding protein n=1 Tax=Sulfuricurvum sp. TaxID=2025608 RepID=UPI00262C6A68|nr:TRAP transporter substrate-binding protein DctP [Sulfuricurvum sp.]MDD2780531.1 TRAP transporter substrate-binding protein DctP [Sulfuricurvum sp.]